MYALRDSFETNQVGRTFGWLLKVVRLVLSVFRIRKNKVKNIVAALTLAVLCTLPLRAQIDVFGALTKKDHPAQVVGTGYLDAEHTQVLVQVKNYTTETITSVKIGWTVHDCVTRSHCGCGYLINETPFGLGVEDTQQVTIAPDLEGDLRFQFPLRRIKNAAAKKGVSLKSDIDLYYGVIGVTFSNGLSWEYDLINEGNFDWSVNEWLDGQVFKTNPSCLSKFEGARDTGM